VFEHQLAEVRVRSLRGAGRCGCISRCSVSVDASAAHNAMNVSTAFAAWEYSHCARSDSQLSGTTVQLVVARLAGCVQTKKITIVAVMDTKATSDSQNCAPRPRCTIVSTRLATIALINTIPVGRGQPR
jgi:hypothetical protein